MLQFKMKHISDVKLRKPGNKKGRPNEKLGNFRAKKVDYDVYSLGDDTAQGDEESSLSIGASEMKSLIPLLSDKTGQYTASKPKP